MVNGQFFLFVLNFFSELQSAKMMGGEFIMKKSVLLGLVIIPLFNYSEAIWAQKSEPIPTIKLSGDTENYFKNTVLKSCKKLKKNDFYVDYYFKCFKDDFNRSRINSYCESNLDQYVSKLECSPSEIKTFNKMKAVDALPLHKYKIASIKEEISDFKKKNLSASFQMAKYINYKKDNSLEDEVIDPETEALVQNDLKSVEARKNSCSDVINLKEPLALNRPKNQDTIGWCYSYTASDLVAHVLGREPSAVHMATLMNDKFLFKLFGVKEGGWTDSVIDEMIDEGMCLEKDLPSTDYKFATNSFDLKSVFQEIIDLSKKYYSSPNDKNNQDSFTSGSKSKEYTKEEIAYELCHKKDKLLKGLGELFPKMNMDQLTEVLLKTSSSDAFKKMADISCPITKDKEMKNLKVRTVSSNDEVYKTLDEQLDKGNILGLHYKAETLYHYKNNVTFTNHASSIVGRRFNPKTMSCEYLLRNSWGKECGSYYSDYDCKDGHVWIAEDFFKYNKSIGEVIYVEKK